MCAAESSSNQLQSKLFFRIKKHRNHCSDYLLYLYKQNKFCDLTWKIGNGENSFLIQGHKIVLCAFSEFFSEHFGELNNMTPHFCTTENASSLKSIFDFIYSGWIELNLENVEGILRVAGFLKIKFLVNGCLEFMEMNICASHAAQWYKASFENPDLSGLQPKLKEFLRKHADEVMLYAGVDVLEGIFDNESISEKKVFTCVLAWINHDIPNRAHFGFELFSKINFRLLPPNLITENRETIYEFKKINLMKLIRDWLKWYQCFEKYKFSEPIKEPSLDRQNDAIVKVLSSNDVSNATSKLKIVEISELNEIRIRTFHRETKSWTFDQPPLPHSFSIKNFSTTVIENKLIFVGGEDASGSKMSSVKCLDLHTLRWTYMFPMKNGRSSAKLAYSNGLLFVSGKSEDSAYPVEVYIFSVNKWIDVDHPLSSIRMTKYSEIASYNGMLYWLDFYNGYLKIYDISSNFLTTKQIEKECLDDFEFVAVEGFLYVIDGVFNYNVRRYNLSNDMWTEVAKLPNPDGNYIKSTVCQNKIVTCTTNDDNDEVVHEFNLATKTWTELSSFKSDGSFKPYNIFIPTAQKS